MAECSRCRYISPLEQGALTISSPINEYSGSNNIHVSSLQPENPRLNENNYRFWVAQVLNSVGRYDLEDHLTVLVAFASPFILVKNVENNKVIKLRKPQYVVWNKPGRCLTSLVVSLYLKGNV